VTGNLGGTNWLGVLILGGAAVLCVLLLLWHFARLRRAQQETLEQLRRVSEDYRRIFENAHDPIFIFTPEDEKILNANHRACEVYGFSHEELLGMSLIDISEDVPRGREQVAQTLRTGVYNNFESMQFRKDGSPIFLEINASLIEYEGRPAILSINRDVTERRKAEELRLAKEAAEQADKAKTQFLANMSHEIRTPLAGVIGLADLLLRSGLEGSQRDYASLIQSSSASLLRLIDDILDLSKVEAGMLLFETAPFGLRALLNDVCGPQRLRALEKGIALELHVADSVPEWVEGDPARLRQVLLNLIGNAVKFTERGRVDLEVTPGPPGLVFRVRDTGIGIPKEAHGRMFSLFTQADSSTSRRFGGTGLGLAISRRIVEQMGGEIGFESTPGRGSLFWFRLPLPPAAPPANKAARIVAPSPAEGRTHRILVAEDEPINQLVTTRQLQAFGYQVTAVSTGLEALAALEESPYDLALMDCQMPELDGYETARRIRAHAGERWQLPIVALTAHAMKEDLERCLEAGMNDYVTKPFRPEALRRILKRWLAPHPAAGPKEPRLDRSRLEGLRELGRIGGRDLVAELVTKFEELQPLTSLRQAQKSGDREAMKFLAHRLKGSGANLGAVRLARLCGELEAMAPEARLEDCTRQIELIAQEYEKVLPELAGAAGG
jgi:PAS domain S-box-containing protein